MNQPTATISLTQQAFLGIVMGMATVEDLVAGGSITIEGDAAAFADLIGLLDTFEFWFNIATP